jgi:hypothetical protein
MNVAMIFLDQLNSNFWRKYHAVPWDDVYFKGGDILFLMVSSQHLPDYIVHRTILFCHTSALTIVDENMSC